MEQILLVVHVFLALGLIGLVMLQHGKGADMGAAFGSGASSTVFGARGSGSFLTRATAILATLFFCTSLVLAIMAGKSQEETSIMDQQAAPAVPEQAVPAAPSDVPELPEPATSDTPDVPN